MNDYVEDIGDGPDPEDLHFEMTCGPDSVWNRRVLELLLEKLKEEDGDELPERSDAYWLDIMAKRFTSLRTPWTKAQRRITSSGELETPEEVDGHVKSGFSSNRTRARKATRRQTVSSKLLDGH